MKNKPEFIIVGGDSRFSYMENILKTKGYNAKRIYPGSYTADDFSKANVFILPVPVSRDGKNINTPLSDEQFYIGDFLRLLPKNCIVAGGMIGDEVTQLLKAKNIDVFDYYKSEMLTEKNASITAEGAIGVIINSYRAAVENLKCAVTGYGRCGKAICEKLSDLGAEITAVVRSDKSYTDAEKNGLNACYLSDFAAVCNTFDVIINTVPVRIISEEILSKVSSDCLLIEIASSPFGIDFDCAKKLKINTIKAGGLPGRTSPFTAGKIICDEIINYYWGDEYGN